MTLKAYHRLHTVTVELLRNGPPHNQLLSPLTDYLALCGNHPAVSVRVPYEHGQFEHSVDPLFYRAGIGPDSGSRESIMDTGQKLSNMLSEIPGLSPGLAEAAASECDMTHLQLVLTPNELALLPFECMFVPDGAPGGHGQFLMLQVSAPVCMTRAVRGVSGENVVWPAKPRVLFAWASPPGTGSVPFEDHLLAIRQALTPWIKPYRGPDDSVEEKKRYMREQIKDLLTIIPNASINTIYLECSKTAYTHVHILAHGIPQKIDRRNRSVGLGLFNPADPSQMEIVEGRNLANALRFRDPKQPDRSSLPSMVTIASCNSGEVGSVISHGASIAHDLHIAGVPFVLASQFPLSKLGSIVMAEELYARVFKAEDPRVALHYVRRRLYSRFCETHDWASIVSYAALPSRFEEQLAEKQFRVAKYRINGVLEEADALIDRIRGGQQSSWKIDGWDLDETDTEKKLMDKLGELKALEDELIESGPIAVESLGIAASAEKRKAEILFWASHLPHIVDSNQSEFRNRSLDALTRSRNYYENALMRDLSQHWVLVQYVSLTRILMAVGRVDESFPEDHWNAAKLGAEFDLRSNDLVTQSWAHGSLAELYLLHLIVPLPGPNAKEAEELASKVLYHIGKMIELSRHNSFEIYSTRRQFARYVEWWGKLEAPASQSPPAEHYVPQSMIIPDVIEEVLNIMPDITQR